MTTQRFDPAFDFRFMLQGKLFLVSFLTIVIVIMLPWSDQTDLKFIST